MIHIDYNKISVPAYIYVFLPVLLFVGIYSASVATILLSIATITFLIWNWRKRKRTTCKPVAIRVSMLVAFFLIAFLWSFLGGQGNLYYQSSDWTVRNLLYRDLIYRSWPVTYPDFDKALCYYISYWLPTATITKIVGLFFPVIYESELAFKVGNILLLFWTTAGVFIAELLLVCYAAPKSTFKMYLVPIVLIFFSGLDIIGVIRKILVYHTPIGLHIEWWLSSFQFSSLTTCLFWVFNQTIIPWIVILCIMQEQDFSHYVLLAAAALSSGPIPFCGIAVYMLINVVYQGVLALRTKKVKPFFKDCFSPLNCIVFLIVIVLLLFYSSNAAISAGAEKASGDTISILFFTVRKLTPLICAKILAFLFLEAGIYLILLYRKNKTNVFYYATIAVVLIAPLLKIGLEEDFVMRFSIPAVMAMAAMSLKYLSEYEFTVDVETTSRHSLRGKMECTALIICLLIGSITPLTEFMRGYSAALNNGKFDNIAIDPRIQTLNQDEDHNDSNFVTYGYKEKLYFKLFLKDE